ncbi:MAG: MBL fold metallo-hydrolase [Promethearchaeota archaeon]
MKITFLGTSGFGVSASRNPPAILVDAGVLLDAGEGATKRLVELGLDPARIEAIFVSHAHRDHLMGFWGLLWQMMLVCRKKTRLDVYGLRGVIEDLQSLVEAPYMPLSLQEFALEYHVLEANGDRKKKAEVKLNGELASRYIVEYAPSRHSVPALAYRIRDERTGKTLGYGGDGTPAPELSEFFQGCDLLVLEATFPDDMEEMAKKTKHSTPSGSARVARDAGAGELVLTHLPPAAAENAGEFLLEAKKIHENTRLAKDGMIVEF